MTQRYQVLFQGELLAGFDPTQTRADTALLLNAGPSQIAQLFSGRQVGIRKNLSASEAARYRVSLSRIGLRVHVIATPDSSDKVATSIASPESKQGFRITYSGEVLPGLPRHDVMQRVSQKLHLDEVRLTRLFSGKGVILKKGLSAEAATRYLAEAAQLGMLARMETEFPAALPVATASNTPVQTTSRFMESAVKTQLYSPRAPLYDREARASSSDDIRTLVDIDLMRSLNEEPAEQAGYESAEDPMPQVRVWRPPAPLGKNTAETALAPAAVTIGPPAMPELALRSIALHIPQTTAPVPAPRRKPALQRLAEMSALLPRALSRILQ